MRQLRPCIFPLNLSTSGKQGVGAYAVCQEVCERFYTMSFEYHFATEYYTTVIVYEYVMYMPRVDVFLLAAK